MSKEANSILTQVNPPNYAVLPDKDKLNLAPSDYAALLTLWLAFQAAATLEDAVTLTPATSVAGVLQVQHIAPSGTPASGVFKLNFGGNATANINWNDSAATIQAALRLLAGLAAVVVTGTIAGGLNISMAGVAGDPALMTVTANTVATSVPAAVTFTITKGTAGVLAVQTLTTSAVPDAGSYVLNFGGHATTPIAFNANAAAVQTALRLLTGLSLVTVSGSFATAFSVTFAGFAGPATLMTVTNNTLGIKDSTDNVIAHQKEYELRREILNLIYDGKGNVKWLADWALQTGNVDYTRGFNP